MIKLGITGGIGSGKSYVTRFLQQKGIPVYYTDDEARRLMVENPSIRSGLINLLGEQVYIGDGILNKKLLAEYLFSDSSHVMAINNIVHPVVRNDFSRWASRQSQPIIAMECAILYEANFDLLVDKVLAVYAPEGVRITRVMSRDGIPEKQVRERMQAQWSDEERCRRADFTLCNDGRVDVEIELAHILHCLSE